MFDLLEWETLCVNLVSRVNGLSQRGGGLTESFSTIPTEPAREADSNVNMELSRWQIVSTCKAREKRKLT